MASDTSTIQSRKENGCCVCLSAFMHQVRLFQEYSVCHLEQTILKKEKVTLLG